MKLKLLIVCMTFLSLKTFGQDAAKVFEGVKNATPRNAGPIIKNNLVKGYYNFYEFDKVDHKQVLYRLNLLDEDLNNLGTKDIIGPKEWSLIGSGFDGNNYCFKFWDQKKKTFELKVYDQEANEIVSSSLKINYNPDATKPKSFTETVNPDLNILENNGFLDYTFNDPNNAFIMSYVNGNTKTSWQKTYEPEGKSKVMFPTFLKGNSDIILTAVSRIERGLDNMKTEESLLATNVKDGSTMFDLSTDIGDNHVVPIDAVFYGDKITIIGLNFSSNKTYSTSPEGLAFIEVDKQGKILKSSFKTFDQALGKFLTIDDHKLNDGYYFYIHNIVSTNHGTNVIIAEKFKKTGTAGAVLSMLGGSTTGGGRLQLENMLVIEIDKDGNALMAKEVPKTIGTTEGFPGSAVFLPPYLLASLSNYTGQMNYMYTQKSDDNSQITFSFVDYGKISDDAKKTENFGQISYKDGKINVDKFPIKNEKATFSKLYRAKINHVLQVNYFKKDKKMTLNLIKLNN